MKEFNLGSKVVVSDPCYVLPTWCHAVITGVLPGKYIGEVTKTDGTDGWGIRVATLSATHEDYVDRFGFLDWEQWKGSIGVDSGQCGIFDFEHYRKDKRSDTYGLPLIWGGKNDDEDGHLWYERMCSLTLSKGDGGVSDDDWGITPDGVVSSTGYGNGSYTLMLGKVEEQVVAFEIIYIGSEDEEDPWEEDDEDNGNEGFPDQDEIDRLTADLN